MYRMFIVLLTKVFEAIYFSLILINGKKLKDKRIILNIIMIAEYLLLTSFIEYNVIFQLIYTFLSYINLKILYGKKAQITDIFLFGISSIVLIIISAFSYFIVYFTIGEYLVALLLNRLLVILFLVLTKNKLSIWYKKYYSLWNRHFGDDKPKIKSLTLRNISLISFNFMFVIINFGMVFFLNHLR